MDFNLLEKFAERSFLISGIAPKLNSHCRLRRLEKKFVDILDRVAYVADRAIVCATLTYADHQRHDEALLSY